MWDTSGPAYGQNNSVLCSQSNQAPGCVYEDELFTRRVLATINAFNASDPTTPLFFVWATHSAHEPYEVPTAYLEKFSFIDVQVRQYYCAMVNYIDDQIGVVIAALKAKGLWDNMLFVMSSDNGGPLAQAANVSGLVGVSGGNNYPLRGGKMSNTEGGVRVNAFATGGLIPTEMRGTTSEAFIAVRSHVSYQRLSLSTTKMLDYSHIIPTPFPSSSPLFPLNPPLFADRRLVCYILRTCRCRSYR